MDLHRRSTILLCLLCAGLISVKIGGCKGDLQPAVAAAFGGGYYNLRLPSPGQHLTASLLFNSSRGQGLVMLALGADNVSYVAVGLNAQGIVASTTNQRVSSPTWCSSSSSWCTLTVEANSSSLVVTTDGSTRLYLTLQPITFATVYIGGVPSFLTPPFSLLPVASSFVGCLANVTVNDASPNFVPTYGIEAGCCSSPGHVTWTFYGHASSLRVPFPPNLNALSQFELYWEVLVEGDGTLLSSMAGDSTLLVKVMNGVAFVQLQGQGEGTLNLSCRINMSDGQWHMQALTLSVYPSLTVVTCTVDSMSSSGTLITTYSPGSDLHFGSRQDLPVNSRAGFDGSIRNPKLNDLDIVPNALTNMFPDTPFVGGVCPCQLFDYNIWNSVSPLVKTAVVDQGEGVLVDSNVLTVNLPLDSLTTEGAALKSLYYSAIVFHVTTPPSYGSIRLGPTAASRVATFTYSNFASGSIFYQQEGDLGSQDNVVRDEVDLDIMVVCGGRTRRLSSVTLYFSIQRHLYVISSHDLPVVLGTRVLITNYTIAFADVGTPPTNLKYTVVQTSGTSVNPGTVENIYGVRQVYFTQADIDAGQIVFNHNRSAGINPVVIELRVSNDNAQSVAKQIAVFPYLPTFNISTSRPLGLIARTNASLGLANLMTSTNFGAQFPIIMYTVAVPPKQGYVAVKQDRQWVNASSFTQAQVVSGSVLFVHTGLATGVDSFRYNVSASSVLFPGSNLIGPEGELVVQIVQIKNLAIWVSSNVRVARGGGVILNSTVLNVTLEVEGSGSATLVEESILLSVAGPSHGSLSLSGLIVTNGSFSLCQLREGKLVYTHDGSKASTDSFWITTQVKIGSSLNYDTRSVLVLVTIASVNSHAPSLTQRTPINPTEGLWVALTPDMLSAADEDQSEASLVFSVTVNGSGGFEGYFAHKSDTQATPGALQPITTFKMSDIFDGHIIFVHSSGSVLNGVVTVVVTDDGGLQCIGTVVVMARPLNIMASPVNLPGLPCVALVNATSASPVFNMNQSMVNLDLNDIGRKPSVMVFVMRGPAHGTLQWNTTLIFTNTTDWVLWDQFSVMSYTLDPFAAKLPGITNDSFSLEFVLGHGSSQSVRFDVCIRPIPVPSMSYIGSPTVFQGGVGFLNGSILQGTDTDQSPSSKLVYSIQSPPTSGYIYRTTASGVKVTNFTQEQVSANQIAYKHVQNQTLRDSFTFILGNGYAETSVYRVAFNITITSLVVTNRGFNCTEGESHIITTDELNVVAPAGYNVTFYLLDTLSVKGQPHHGQLVTAESPPSQVSRFTPLDLAMGKIQYVHDGSETQMDSFQFVAIATPTVPSLSSWGNLTAMDAVYININLVNDNAPILINHTLELSAFSGEILQFDSSMLAAYDADESDSIANSKLQYILAVPVICGELRLWYRSEPVTTFLEADIRNGSLYYRNTNTKCLYDYLWLYISDGYLRQASPELTIINIKEVDVMFTASCSMFIKVPKKESGIITTSSLSFTAKISSVSQDILYTSLFSRGNGSFLYRITTKPQYGELLLLTEPATTFTQVDVDSNKISYHHNGANIEKDTFHFTVTLLPQNFVSPVQDFSINVQPVDDEPPIMTVLKSPLYAIEGSVVEFTRSSMCAYVYFHSMNNRDCSKLLSSMDNIGYMVIKAPLYGNIELNRYNSFGYVNTSKFSQLDINLNTVRYNSTAIGHYADSFIFKIYDANNNQPTPYQGDIVLLPQVLLLNVTGFTIFEGGLANLSCTSIVVLHPYLTKTAGMVTVQTLPRFGTLKVLGRTLTAGPLTWNSADLQNGGLVYVHDHSDTVYDQFQFVYTIKVEDHTIMSNLTTFPIRIVPVNDEPPVLEPSAVRLNVWIGETVVLDARVLNATDTDTDNVELVYTITASSGGAFVAKASNRTIPVLSFSQQDVVNCRLLLVHQSGSSGNLTLNLTDGVAFFSGSINWFASELVLTLANAKNLTVPMGERVPLTSANLLVISNDTRPQGTAVYRVVEVTYGVLMRDLDITGIIEFNQTEVDAGRISYFHTKLDYWEPSDMIKLRVVTRITANPYLLVSLPVSIQLPSTVPERAVNRPLYVLRGGQQCLNESFLDARNLRYDYWKKLSPVMYPTPGDLQLTYTITAGTQHGVLLVRNMSARDFSHEQLSKGLVCYLQNGPYAPNDLFGFGILLGSRLLSYTFQMTIVIIPTHVTPPSLTLAAQQVFLQGFPAAITNTSLRLTDVDTPPEELVYYATSLPSNGELSLLRMANPTSFSQASINRGLLLFRPGSIGNSTFTFNFTNGVCWGGGSLTLSVVAHTLTAAPVQFLVYKQTSHSGIVQLNANTNGNRSENLYTVNQPPRSGYIIVRSSQVSSFSQQDVDKGNVLYSPFDLSVYSDIFTVNVTNRDKIVTNVSVVVTVAALGQVRTGLQMNMSGYLSQSLPADSLDLDLLQKRASLPPTIYVYRPPSYGYLTMSYLLKNTRRASNAQGGPMFSFRYDDLKNGWINYTWAPRQYVNWSKCFNDSFTVLVQAKGFQVGMIDVPFTVLPPVWWSWEASAAPTTNQPLTATSSAGIVRATLGSSTLSSDKFPIYALVPIGGVFILVPMIALTVVLLYCIQRKSMKLKFLQAKEVRGSPSPWRGQHPPMPQLPSPMTHYQQDAMSVESEEGDLDRGGSQLGGGSQRTSSAMGRPHSSSSQGYIPRRHGSNVMVNISQQFLSEHSLEHPAISPSPLQGGGRSSLRSSSRSPTKSLPSEAVVTSRNMSADSGFRSAAVGVSLSGSRGTIKAGAMNSSPDVKEHLYMTNSIPILKNEEYWV